MHKVRFNISNCKLNVFCLVAFLSQQKLHISETKYLS